MLISYKIEVFILPLISALIILAIDIGSSPDYIFFDYNNLNTTQLEDIVAFGVVAILLNMFSLMFFHLYRCFKLKYLDNKIFLYRRIILFASNLIFFVLIIIAALIDSDYDDSINDDMMALVLFITECLFIIVYYAWFFKESRYVYQYNIKSEISLINELHDS